MTWPFGEMQPGAYGAIVADPPWHFRSRTALQSSNWTSRRDAEKHYPVMGTDDIAALPVKQLAAKDCHLFLWTTGPCLPLAFEVITAWGFRYSSVAFTWVKMKRSHNAMQLRILPGAESDLHLGLGMTTRKNAEFCLLARRGSCKRASKSVREIIMSPVREHSRKPEESRDRIEQYVGPDVRVAELFAREPRPGWDAWGFETEKFAPPAAA
ncbi:MT-A70 family methyltransferase [Bauldia litoralis]|uniref:MT-A70 family methyltransferase n=1 Tax=Bauldia litoralis TaxID=665467 RepID=UPI003265F4F2